MEKKSLTRLVRSSLSTTKGFPMKRHILLFFALGTLSSVTAQPYLPDQLDLRAVLNLATDAGAPASSTFNPRYFDSFLYANQVNAGTMAFGRYVSGWPIPLMVLNNVGGTEHRMVAPFRGANAGKYLLGSSSGAAPQTTTFSRYDFDGLNRVDAPFPGVQTVEGFDWVDDDTIIATSYTSGNRRRLYLADVVAEPFELKANTTWNTDGYIISAASTRLRNVRVGGLYNGFAYYGDNGVNSSPNFYALNLTNGVETLLGNAGELTGSGSFGIWTVVERGGYLYVQTTDNGIQVYSMNNATSLGALHGTYEKATLDMLAGYAGQYYGLDVSPDGRRLVLGAAGGRIYEFGSVSIFPKVTGSDLTISWPTLPMVYTLQVSSSSAPDSFTDIVPQPVINSDTIVDWMIVPQEAGNKFYRLRK